MAELKVRQNALQRFLQFIPSSALGAYVFSKMLHYMDRPIMKLTGGKVSLPQFVNGIPCVTLTSTGAKSGVERTIPTNGIPDGENIALVASNWGQTHHPAWYHNLRKNPEATLRFDGHEGRYTATEIEPGDEYDRLWANAVQVYRGYASYKKRAGNRQIPILLMKPS
ncbi:MAG: nitroreductase family deazaflavin-dependent oxidoreductase [Pseudomonadota bacterium]